MVRHGALAARAVALVHRTADGLATGDWRLE
jgi:hypothetical protein